MSFGVMNAPPTFQALMNDVLQPFLCKFVLMFFDDILIFSPSWLEHLQHVRAVLTKLREHQLFMKKKCSFRCSEEAYLGRVISAAGVAMDDQKVRAVEWPVPRLVHAVCAFLGLAGYYRWFIWDYGAIATSLTALLRKDGFRWSAEAEDAFWDLQRRCCNCRTSGATSQSSAMRLALALAPIFTRATVPSPSPASRSRYAKLAAYEWELIGLVIVVRHWRHYLWGRTFLIRNDHFSLKFLLGHRLSTIPQHQWLSKLLSFDFRIDFKPGTSNIEADALSRRDTKDSGELLALTTPTLQLYEDCMAEFTGDPTLHHLCDKVRTGARR
jgi:hypothetical protein